MLGRAGFILNIVCYLHLKTSGPELERAELTKYTHMYTHTCSHTQTHTHTHMRISRKEEKLISC